MSTLLCDDECIWSMYFHCAQQGFYSRHWTAWALTLITISRRWNVFMLLSGRLHRSVGWQKYKSCISYFPFLSFPLPLLLYFFLLPFFGTHLQILPEQSCILFAAVTEREIQQNWPRGAKGSHLDNISAGSSSSDSLVLREPYMKGCPDIIMFSFATTSNPSWFGILRASLTWSIVLGKSVAEKF